MSSPTVERMGPLGYRRNVRVLKGKKQNKKRNTTSSGTKDVTDWYGFPSPLRNDDHGRSSMLLYPKEEKEREVMEERACLPQPWASVCVFIRH